MRCFTVRTTRAAIALGLAAVFTVAAQPARANPPEQPGSLVQVGTYDYLVQPDFTGLLSINSVRTDQTIGLGTFANLDGELVMVGGQAYRVRPDGTPTPISGTESTPFFQATRFTPQVSVPVPPGTECSALIPLINAAQGSDQGIVAVRIRGTFRNLTARSVTADPPPFQPLATTIAEQTIFPLDGQRAVLVGFRQGSDAKGVGQDGLHLHGLAADRTGGGHILSCTAGDDVELSVQTMASVTIKTPGHVHREAPK